MSYEGVLQRHGWSVVSMNEWWYSESSDAERDAAGKDDGVIELHVQIELQTETELHGDELRGDGKWWVADVSCCDVNSWYQGPMQSMEVWWWVMRWWDRWCEYSNCGCGPEIEHIAGCGEMMFLTRCGAVWCVFCGGLWRDGENRHCLTLSRQSGGLHPMMEDEWKRLQRWAQLFKSYKAVH